MNVTLNSGHKLVVDDEGSLVKSGEELVVYDSTQNVCSVMPDTQELRAFLATNVPANHLAQRQQEEPSENAVCGSSQSKNEIWIKNSGKSTSFDVTATSDLISLVRKERSLLADKKTEKKDVWSNIGQAMQEKGYSFGIREAGLVCHQKWRNIEGNALDYLQNAGPKNTGEGQKNKPSFFDEVYDVIKDTAKAVPAKLVVSLPFYSEDESGSLDPQPPKKLKNIPATTGTLHAPSVCSKRKEGVLSDEEEDNLRSPFSKVKKATRAKVDSNAILTFMKQDAEKREKQNDQLMQILGEKNAQDKEFKVRMLEILSKLAEH